MGKVAIRCFIDLKKAFETVLINKLRKYGIHCNILEWLLSYLDNQKQYVFYNDTKSNDQYISCGVLQGSIRGPLLFILYINDLSNISESILFANDTTVIVESDSVSDAIVLMNLEFIKLNIWLQANKLKGMQRNFEKNYIMGENDSLFEYIKIPLDHNRTNGAVYSKINFKVEICSAL